MPLDEQNIEFTFTTEDDNPIVRAAADAVTPPVELEPKEEIPEVIPETPEKEVPEPEIDLTGFSEAARTALSIQKTDKELPDDLEIKKDLSWKELKQLLKEEATKREEEEEEARLQAKAESEKARLNELGLTDSHYAYIQQIINGGDPQVVSKVAQYRSWAEAELEGEDQHTAVVRAGLMIKMGQGEDAVKMIDSYIKNDLTDSTKLEEAANAQQEYIGKVADYLEDQDRKRVQELKTQEEANEKTFAANVEKQVQSGVYGLKLKKSEEKELIDYMTKKVVVVDTPNGRKKVTQEEADKRRDAADLAKRVYEAHQRKVGYDKVVNKLVDVANTNSTDKYLKSIKQIEEGQTQVPVPKKGDVYMEIEI